MGKSNGVSRWFVVMAGLLIGATGWVALVSVLAEWPLSQERDWRLVFFVALWLAVGGTALPLVWLLHRRFGAPRAGEDWGSAGVMARQGAWVTTWVTGCAWLQMHRTLNWPMALLLLVVLVLLEMLLLTRRETHQES